MFDAKVAEQGLQKVVRRLEWQDNVRAWLDTSDVYLHTAAYEGLPLALLEAMGAGLPCVTSTGVLAEAAPLRNGALIAYEDDWTSLLAYPDERRTKAAACLQLFAKYFTAERMALGYADHYERILEQRKAA